MANTPVKAAHLLLDRGLRINIPDAPFFDRIRGRNKIWIKPLRGGTLMEIAILTINRELDKPHTNLQLQAKIKDIAEIIATAMLNDEYAIETKKKKTVKWLLQLPALFLIKVYRYIESLNEIEVFTTITNYFTRQSKMMMAKRTGQMQKGSQKSVLRL